MFDIGVNLTSSQFSRDHDEVVARAQAAGVHGMLLTGTNLHESQQARQMAGRYANCWSTAGVHPHDSSTWTESVAEEIHALARQPQVAAIGECGLDFNRNFSTPQEQEKAFSAQLALAAELSMPVFLHCRDAHQRFLELLEPWLNKLPGAVLHCFTGSREEVIQCLDRGLFIGITGWVCDERRGAIAGDPGGTSAAGDRCAISITEGYEAEALLAAQRARLSAAYSGKRSGLARRGSAMAGGGYGCERQEAVWRALLTAPSDFIEVGIFNALQDLFIQQIEEQH